MNSLKKKFLAGFFIIFFISSIVLNIMIRNTLKLDNENTIKEEMDVLTKNSREFIRQQLLIEREDISEEAFVKSAYGTAVKLSALNGCYVAIRDKEGNIIEAVNTDIEPELLKYSEDAQYALQDKSYINIENKNGRYIGHFSYPIYLRDKLLGIVSFKLDFTNLFIHKNKLINTITLLQFITLLFSFAFSYYMASKITKPLNKLVNGIEEVTEGIYDNKVEVSSKDEIGILADKFNTMREEIKSYVESINKEKDKVIKLEAARTEFFNNVTHELKTPLTGISAYAQILSEGDVNDVEFQARAASRIKEESERLHKMVLDLIEVSKGNTSVDEDFSMVVIKELIESIMEDLNLKAKKYNVSIKEQLEPFYAYVMPNKIRQLIINLMDNAIKYSYDNSEILIECFEDNQDFYIIIKNEAPNIPEMVLNNIFDPFIKGEISKEKGSSGLGLYICKNIVDMHGGTIEMKSGEFTEVKVKIPAK